MIKENGMKLSPRLLLLTAAICGLTSTVFAKSLNLLDQPQQNAKVVASVDLSDGIIPIYSPKDGKWIKIADPKNGNVGWVKTSDLENAGSTFSEFSFSEGPSNAKTYHVIQYGEPARKLTPEQARAIVKEQEARYQAMQRSMVSMMHEMNHMFEDEWMMSHPPMFMPVVFVPVQKSAAAQPKAAPHHKVAAAASSATPGQASAQSQPASKATANANKQTGDTALSVANNAQ